MQPRAQRSEFGERFVGLLLRHCVDARGAVQRAAFREQGAVFAERKQNAVHFIGDHERIAVLLVVAQYPLGDLDHLIRCGLALHVDLRARIEPFERGRNCGARAGSRQGLSVQRGGGYKDEACGVQSAPRGLSYDR